MVSQEDRKIVGVINPAHKSQAQNTAARVSPSLSNNVKDPRPNPKDQAAASRPTGDDVDLEIDVEIVNTYL